MTNSIHTRRDFLKICATTGLGTLAIACAGKGSEVLTASEKRLLQNAETLPIVTWDPKKGDPGSVLRKKAALAGSIEAKRLARIDALMRATLKKSGGVGLAAPQVGLARALFLVQLQNEAKEVITCIDPKMVTMSARQVEGYEGCLSIPGVGGKVARSESITIQYTTLAGKRITYRSQGWEARIFQHEYDHLLGTLYIDKLKGTLLPYDEIRRRRAANTKHASLPLTPTDMVLM